MAISIGDQDEQCSTDTRDDAMTSPPATNLSPLATASGVIAPAAPLCALALSLGAFAWLPLGEEDPDLVAVGIGLATWGALSVAGLFLGALSIILKEPRRVLVSVAVVAHLFVLCGLVAMGTLGVRVPAVRRAPSNNGLKLTKPAMAKAARASQLNLVLSGHRRAAVVYTG